MHVLSTYMGSPEAQAGLPEMKNCRYDNLMGFPSTLQPAHDYTRKRISACASTKMGVNERRQQCAGVTEPLQPKAVQRPPEPRIPQLLSSDTSMM